MDNLIASFTSSKPTVISGRSATGKILSEAGQLRANRNYEAAYKQLLPLAQQGNAEAQLSIGLMIKEGHIFQITSDQGVVPDYQQARFWLEISANTEVTNAEKSFLGLGDWEGVKSAEKRIGNDFITAIAKYELGVLYLHGHGVKKNVETAFALFDTASRLGSPKADFELAKMFALGLGTQQNFLRAVPLLENACANGVTEATCVLAKLYALGHGTNLPPAQAQQRAFSLFQDAYKNGSLEAGYELGKMYMVGCGCQQSLAWALFHFVEASQQVDEAKFEIAKLVLYGYSSFGHQHDGTRNFVPCCEDQYFNQATMNRVRSARLNFDDIDFDFPNLRMAKAKFDSVKTPTSQLYLLTTESVFNGGNVKNSLKEQYEKQPELSNIFPEVHNCLEATSVFTNEVKGLDGALRAMDTYPEAIAYYQSVANNQPPSAINQRARYQNEYGADYSAEHHYFNAVLKDSTQSNLIRGDAAYQLALLHLHGRGVEKNGMACDKYLQQAVEFDDPNAPGLLATLKKQPDMVSELFFMARDFLSTNAEKDFLQGKGDSEL